MQQQQHIQAIMKNGETELSVTLRLPSFNLDVFDTVCFIFFLFLIYFSPFFIGVGVSTCFPIAPMRTFSWLLVGQ
jgi:hypothetical protein